MVAKTLRMQSLQERQPYREGEGVIMRSELDALAALAGEDGDV